MPRSREKIIADLDARFIGYDDEMSYKELIELLEKAKAIEEAEGKKKEAEAQPEEPHPEGPLDIDYSNVKCGASTIQDHERRLCIIERKLGL